MHVWVWRMRTGISITVCPAGRLRLEGMVRDRSAAHKHPKISWTQVCHAAGLNDIAEFHCSLA